MSGGCREPSATIQLSPLLPEVDASAEPAPLPEGAIPCEDDDACDDGIECTRDTCVEAGYCVSAADSSVCSDGVFCNGQELCEPSVGCLPSSPRHCSDDDVCTVDRCDEDAKQCIHTPRDFDADGESDWHCAGGTDCDDFDPTRAQAVPEICADGIDNDCDDRIDEAVQCGTPEHDRCDDALDVSAGGSFLINLAGATPDYAPRCSTVSSSDVAFEFTLETARDVTLIARGLLSDGTEETAVIALRRDCADVATELDCNRGFPGELRLRALPAGRYFAIVSSTQAAQAWLELRMDPETEPPTNTTCTTALPITEDVRIEGNFVDVGDDEQIACGFADANDLFYQFTLDEPRDVEISATSESGDRMNFALRTACDDATTTLRCVSDAPAWARMYQLPAGTYYLALESSPAREVDFSLDVSFDEPSEPPPGHGCHAPLDLPLNTEVEGTLANHQDLVEVQCGCSEGNCNMFRPDTVYRLTLEEPSDLELSVDAGNFLFAYDLRETCDELESQLSCSQAQVSGGRIRDLAAGTYYLILESAGAGNFRLQANAVPRTVPVAAEGNDNCGSAFEIPEEGGLFTGDTLGLLNDYDAQRCGGGALSNDAAFHLQLTMRAEVTASVDATFDSVLYRFTDDGDGALTCESGAEANCNDDLQGGGTDSRLSEILEPGSYYYVVDGFNAENAGRYLFDVTVVTSGP